MWEHVLLRLGQGDPRCQRRQLLVLLPRWPERSSKSANSLFAVELDRRGRTHGIRAFAVHPGGILTGLARYMTDEELAAYGIVRENGELRAPAASFKSVEQGAAPSVWCAVSPALSGKGGVYCEDCDIAPVVLDDSKLRSGVRRWATDKPTARALWDLSEQLTDLQWPN